MTTFLFPHSLGYRPCNVVLEVALTTVRPLLEWKKQKTES